MRKVAQPHFPAGVGLAGWEGWKRGTGESGKRGNGEGETRRHGAEERRSMGAGGAGAERRASSA